MTTPTFDLDTLRLASGAHHSPEDGMCLLEAVAFIRRAEDSSVPFNDAPECVIAALQLDLIERCVRLWSNRGETVLSPFAGIGSELYVAISQHRRAVGCELKPDYFRVASRNLAEAERERDAATLFDAVDA